MEKSDLLQLAALKRFSSLRMAATSLGLPRSTLSYRLAELESRVGREIFVRRGRKLVPTRYGETLLTSAQAALDALEQLDAVTSDVAAGERLTIATSPLMAESIMAPVLQRLRRERPKLRVDVRLGHDYVDLFNGQVDISVRRGPLPNLESLGARPLGKGTLVCVASPKLEMPAMADSEALARATPWIRVGARLEPQLLTLAGGTVAIPSSIAVDNQRVAVDLALRGLGAARVSWFFVREHIAARRLREILPECRATETVYAVYPRRRRLPPLLRDTVDAIAVAAKELDVWDDGTF